MLHILKSSLFISLVLLFSCSGPSKEQQEKLDTQAQLEKDLEMYKYVWERFFGRYPIVNDKYFTDDVVVVTDQGDLVGIEAVKIFI